MHLTNQKHFILGITQGEKNEEKASACSTGISCSQWGCPGQRRFHHYPLLVMPVWVLKKKGNGKGNKKLSHAILEAEKGELT